MRWRRFPHEHARLFQSVRLCDRRRAWLAGVYKAVLWCIASPPSYVIALSIALIGWRAVGRRFAILSGLALLFCAFIGLWAETASTLALVLTATFLALLVAIPLGVLARNSPSIDRVVDPCLELIQTMPPYIYLLPAIALLGYGPATALLATFIVAVPPAFRLTSLGIRMTPRAFIECTCICRSTSVPVAATRSPTNF